VGVDLVVIFGLLGLVFCILAAAEQPRRPDRRGPGLPAETGVISGRVTPPPSFHPALQLFFENVQTDAVEIIPLESGQTSYSAMVPAGCYTAYTWMPDFGLMGGHTVCGDDRPCDDHALLELCVEADAEFTGADIADWHVPETPVTVITGRMVDGTGADPIEDGFVAVWDGHIMTAGQASDLPISTTARRLDLPGTTILPGFINAHVHNAYRPDNLQDWAAAGVTTVRDVGAPVSLRWDALREALAQDPRNARILAAGPLVTCPGGYPIAGNGFPSLTVDSEEEVELEINSLIDRGADVIKIVIESGIGELLSVELATAIVDTAHARGIPVTVHLVLEQDLESALEAGVDDIAHMVLDYVPDHVIQQMVDADVGWVPTLAALAGNGTQMYDNLQRFVAAGGRVAMGNDAGYLPGLVIGMPIAELEWMEFAGMTPMQIIVASTSDAAVICRREDLLGTLEAGKLADVLVVQGDPLVDLRALQKPRLVMHEGEIIRLEGPDPRRPSGRIR
jgi:enamidase